MRNDTADNRNGAPLDQMTRSPLDGVSVLFVDHSRAERDLFAMRFGADCLQLATVASADEAIAQLERGTTELLVTEIQFPRCPGFELIRRMRELPGDAGALVPAIAITSLIGSEAWPRLVQASFAGVIVKPYDHGDLIAAVADASTAIAALRRHRARRRADEIEQRELRAGLTPGVGVSDRPDVTDLADRGVSGPSVNKQRVVSAAVNFAAMFVAHPVDELRIASAILMDAKRESWVVFMRCGPTMMFVEVVVGPDDDTVVRRVDGGELTANSLTFAKER